jgi:hypothetical protein
MRPVALKPTISMDGLNQIDVRVGTILSVAHVSNSENLVQLRVSFGDHRHTIVAGLKTERANPREIEGRQALFVVNLAPRKMRGVLYIPRDAVRHRLRRRCASCPGGPGASSPGRDKSRLGFARAP